MRLEARGCPAPTAPGREAAARRLRQHCAEKATGSSLAAGILRDIWFQAFRRAFGASPQSVSFGGRDWWVFTGDEEEVAALQELEQQLDTSELRSADLERVFAVAAFPSSAEARPELDALEDDLTRLLAKKFGATPPEGDLLQRVAEDGDFDRALLRFDELWRACRAVERAAEGLLRDGFAEAWRCDPEALWERCEDEFRAAVLPRCGTAVHLRRLLAAASPCVGADQARRALGALKAAVVEEICIQQRRACLGSSPTSSDQTGLRALWPVFLSVPDLPQLLRLERCYFDVFATAGRGRPALGALPKGDGTDAFRGFLASFRAEVLREVRATASVAAIRGFQSAGAKLSAESTEPLDAHAELLRMVEQLGACIVREEFSLITTNERHAALSDYFRVAVVTKELARRNTRGFFKPSEGAAGRRPYGRFSYVGENFHVRSLEDLLSRAYPAWCAQLSKDLALRAYIAGDRDVPAALTGLLESFACSSGSGSGGSTTASTQDSSDDEAPSPHHGAAGRFLFAGTPPLAPAPRRDDDDHGSGHRGAGPAPGGSSGAPGLDDLREMTLMRLGDIRFARDATCLEFADAARFGRLHNLVGLLRYRQSPDPVLHSNFIEVVPFRSRDGEVHYFSADSRRLFAMRAVFPMDLEVNVYKYSDAAAYDAAHWISWAQVFTTVTDGRSIRLRPRGHARSLGPLFERNVLVCTEPKPEELGRWKRWYRLDDVLAEACEESGLKFVVVRGGRAEVDRVGRWLSDTQARPSPRSTQAVADEQHSAELGDKVWNKCCLSQPPARAAALKQHRAELRDAVLADCETRWGKDKGRPRRPLMQSREGKTWDLSSLQKAFNDRDFSLKDPDRELTSDDLNFLLNGVQGLRVPRE